MIFDSQKEVDTFLATFSPEYYRLHTIKLTSFPVMIKHMIIQDVYKEVYFCPFYLLEAKILYEH